MGVISYLVFIFAGFITGIITGLVGASAIVVFVPLVLLFINYNLFVLIGVSLSVDAFVSLLAIFIYKKFNNIDFKTGFYLAIPAIVGAVLGGYFSKFLPNANLLWISSLLTMFTGIILYRRKANVKEVHSRKDYSKKKFIIGLILAFFVGLLGGSFGAAGGIAVFLLLVFFLNFETHIAIGTSILVMFFIAVFGSIAHIPRIDAMGFHWELLWFAVLGGVLGALFSSKLANKISEKKLNKMVGTILFFLGFLTFINNLLGNY